MPWLYCWELNCDGVFKYVGQQIQLHEWAIPGSINQLEILKKSIEIFPIYIHGMLFEHFAMRSWASINSLYKRIPRSNYNILFADWQNGGKKLRLYLNCPQRLKHESLYILNIFQMYFEYTRTSVCVCVHARIDKAIDSLTDR